MCEFFLIWIMYGKKLLDFDICDGALLKIDDFLFELSVDIFGIM